MNDVVSIKDLLEAGVHFGHQRNRWNPAIKRYIFGEKNGIHIIDLQQTIKNINIVYEFVKKIVTNKGYLLFVGTKKQIQDIMVEEAIRCNMPYVNLRWLGGTLTNFSVIRKSVDKLRKMEEILENTSSYTKKEISLLQREKNKLFQILNGIKTMNVLPQAIFITDVKKEQTAIKEAFKIGIPIIAIIDTNCDPKQITYPIPANDDAIKSVKLITSTIANACIEANETNLKKEQVLEELVDKKD
ncbi:MAG: 30S ribosomal protein S2 [bacterium]